MSLTRLVATYLGPDDTPARGTVTFELSAAVYDSDDQVLRPQVRVTKTLAGGALAVDLLPHDDPGINVVGTLTYRVTEQLEDCPRRVYYVAVPVSAGDIDLGTLAPQGTSGPVTAPGVASVNGESGIVTLTTDDISDSGQTHKFTDATTVAAAGAVMASTIDAKGDLLAGTANDTVSRLAVGTDDVLLTPDSSAATGLAWATTGRASGLLAPKPTAQYGIPRLVRAPDAATGDLGLPGWAGSDTGWRVISSWTAGVQDATNQIGTIDLTQFSLAGSGEIRLRRRGGEVTLWFWGGSIIKTNSETHDLWGPGDFIPAGFRRATWYSSSILSRYAAAPCAVASGNSNKDLTVWVPAAGVNFAYTSAHWPTDDAWPSSLPGTSVGGSSPASWT